MTQVGTPNPQQTASPEDFEDQPDTTVLVVDDDIMIRRLLEEALTVQGYQAATAPSGEKALEILPALEIDVIITDLAMPGMSGLELIRLTNVEYPHIPKIIITGAGTLEDAIEAIRIGAYDYVKKPLNLGELWIVLDRAVKNRRLLVSNIEYQKKLKESNLYLEQRVRERTEELEQSMRLKDDFLSHLSHEILTPLAPLKGYLSIVRQNLHDPATVEASLLEAQKEATRLQHLLENLIDLSSLVMGGAEVVAMPTDLNGCIEKIIAAELDNARKKALQLTTELDQHLPVFLADSDKVEQVITHLLTNAIKFSHDGGAVTLTTARQGDEACFTISDTGIGIPEDKLAGIFDAFHQVDGSTRRKHGGTGIGLSLAKQLVELHGGRITVVSEPGKGSIFTVFFPMEVV